MPADQTVMAAGEFRLVSKDGRTVAQLCLDATGGPLLAFYDKEGRARVYVGISGTTATLDLRDGRNRASVRIRVSDDGQVEAAAYDSNEAARAQAWLSAAGELQLRLER